MNAADHFCVGLRIVGGVLAVAIGGPVIVLFAIAAARDLGTRRRARTRGDQ